MSKKVLIIHNIFWSRYKALIFNSLAHLSQKEGFYIYVIHFSLTETNRKCLGKIDYKIHRYPYKVLFNTDFEKVPFLLGCYKLYKEIINYKPNYIIIPGYSSLFCWFALFLSKILLRSKIIISFESNEFDKPRYYLKEKIKSIFIRLCDGAICFGKKNKEYLNKLGMYSTKIKTGCHAVDIEYLRNSFDNLKDQRPFLLETKRIKKYNFLFVGRLAEEKNVEMLIKAFHYLKKIKYKADDWGLIIVGDGYLKEKLKNYVEQRRIDDVLFTGGIDWEQIVEYYSISDVLILPSLSEPWGLVVNEAMACRLPIIISNRAGCAYDLVQDGINGFIINPFNEKELIEKMEYFIENPRQIRIMGDKSWNIISNFTPENAAKKIKEHIFSL